MVDWSFRFDRSTFVPDCLCSHTTSVNLVVPFFDPGILSSSYGTACPSMEDPDHPTKTAVVIDRNLPSIAEVRETIEYYILTLEPGLKKLNRHVSNNFTLTKAATRLTISTDLREPRTRLQRTRSPRRHLQVLD